MQRYYGEEKRSREYFEQRIGLFSIKGTAFFTSVSSPLLPWVALLYRVVIVWGDVGLSAAGETIRVGARQVASMADVVAMVEFGLSFAGSWILRARLGLAWDSIGSR